MMKKHIVIALVAVVSMLSVSAQAQVTTEFRWWNTTAGSLVNADGNIPAQDATILTFLTDNPAANPAAVMAGFSSYSAAAAALGAPYGVHPNLGAGRFNTNFMQTSLPETGPVGDYAWALVLDIPFASFTSLADVNDTVLYGVAGLSPEILNLNIPPIPLTPQSFLGYEVQTLSQIPEPGTMAFMLLGMVALGVRKVSRRYS